jgi:hypothetical protein
MRTVISHFFNEEYLLPWWLEHHKNIFDHGILIDYHSTDRSVEIIKEICPTWQIVTTRNNYFDSAAIDREVEDYEHQVSGWRIALNVTEFLYGDFDQLNAVTEPTQHFIGNYVFVDPNPGQTYTHELPLHEQCRWGYYEDSDGCTRLSTGARASRSLHNYNIRYHPLGGRHWQEAPTLCDLAIFYYGYAILNEANLARKLQIFNKMSPEEQGKCRNSHPNGLNQSQFLNNIDLHHRPRCYDLSDTIAWLSS